MCRIFTTEEFDKKKETQLEKELEAVRTMEKPIATQQAKAPPKVPVSSKTQAIRDDPEIRKFVDRVLREK